MPNQGRDADEESRTRQDRLTPAHPRDGAEDGGRARRGAEHPVFESQGGEQGGNDREPEGAQRQLGERRQPPIQGDAPPSPAAAFVGPPVDARSLHWS